MVRAFDPEGPRDLLFIPVAVNYDRVLEDRNLLAELNPATPRPSRWQTISGFARFVSRNIWLRLRGGWYRFGYAVVNFGPPISLRAYLAERHVNLQHLEREDRIARVQTLAADLMTAVAAIVPVVPAALVAEVFATAGGGWLDDLEWKSRANALMLQLEARGASLYIPRDSRSYALESGLRMLTLRHLLDQEGDRFRADEKNFAVLKYYASSIEHLLPAPSAMVESPAA